MPANSPETGAQSSPVKLRKAIVLETTLELSNFVLTTLQNGAQFSPVPYLSEAAGLVLTIINAVQSAAVNQEAFKRLANDAGNAMSVILCNLNEGQHSNTDLSRHLQQLLKTLHSIEELTRKNTKRSRILRIFMYQQDIRLIQEYRERLKQSLDLFGLQSGIGLHESLNQFSKKQEILLQTLRESELTQEVISSPSLISSNHALPEHTEKTPDLDQPHIPTRSVSLGSANDPSVNLTTISGNMVENNASTTVTNIKSGNTNQTTIIDSYNRSSSRGYARVLARRGKTL